MHSKKEKAKRKVKTTSEIESLKKAIARTDDEIIRMMICVNQMRHNQINRQNELALQMARVMRGNAGK